MSPVELFISHSSKDSEIVCALVQLLRDSLNIPADNVRCTSVEGYGLSGGARTDEQLREEVASAKSFIALITDASLKSNYAMMEFGARWGTGRGLIPLLASGAAAGMLGRPLEDFHSLSADKKPDIHLLVESLARVLGRKPNSVVIYEKAAAKLWQTSRKGARLRKRLTLSAPMNDYKDAPDAAGAATPEGERKDGFVDTRYVDHIADRGELDALHEYCTTKLTGSWASLDTWRERYDKNPRIFHMVKAIRKKGFESTEKLVGTFALTPITEETRRLLEKEEVVGVGFTADHIAAPGERPAALYLTGIVASEGAKGYTELLLSWKLQQEAEAGNRLVYTRPFTKDGMRLVKKYEFSPVNAGVGYNKDGEGHIFKKEIN
jgi:hypothetical protein